MRATAPVRKGALESPAFYDNFSFLRQGIDDASGVSALRGFAVVSQFRRR
jgi:hypothetical protein